MDATKRVVTEKKKAFGDCGRKHKVAASSGVGSNSSRAWAAREAGIIGSYYGGIDHRFELGGGAFVNL